MSVLARAVFVSIVCVGSYSQSYARDAEQIFDEANGYTVRIDVTVTTAFSEEVRGAGHGAGFLVDDKRRWVMTNAHVASRSPSTLEVIAADGSRVSAHKIYVDPYVDVAIIELHEAIPELTKATLGCSQKSGTGHPVGAFGHPWGLNFTGTQGVISGSTERWGPTHLQTDTPINDGNSGGPLISMKTGRVIGINSSSIDSEDDQNTNFAVPIAQACRILDLLVGEADPSPPALAIDFYDTVGEDDKLLVARSFLPEQDIQLLEGDEIIAVDGRTVSNVSELVHWLRGNLQNVSLTVRRNMETIELSGQLSPAPIVIDRLGVLFSGVLFAASPIEDSGALGASTTVMVHDIEQGSDGNGAGIEVFDFLVRVNGIPVRDLAQLRSMLASAGDSGEKTILDFLRIANGYASQQLLKSVRREIKWTLPEDVGRWPVEQITSHEY